MFLWLVCCTCSLVDVCDVCVCLGVFVEVLMFSVFVCLLILGVGFLCFLLLFV